MCIRIRRRTPASQGVQATRDDDRFARPHAARAVVAYTGGRVSAGRSRSRRRPDLRDRRPSAMVRIMLVRSSLARTLSREGLHLRASGVWPGELAGQAAILRRHARLAGPWQCGTGGDALWSDGPRCDLLPRSMVPRLLAGSGFCSRSWRSVWRGCACRLPEAGAPRLPSRTGRLPFQPELAQLLEEVISPGLASFGAGRELAVAVGVVTGRSTVSAGLFGLFEVQAWSWPEGRFMTSRSDESSRERFDQRASQSRGE